VQDTIKQENEASSSSIKGSAASSHTSAAAATSTAAVTSASTAVTADGPAPETSTAAFATKAVNLDVKEAPVVDRKIDEASSTIAVPHADSIFNTGKQFFILFFVYRDTL
jgi:hypothetical protein